MYADQQIVLNSWLLYCIYICKKGNKNTFSLKFQSFGFQMNTIQLQAQHLANSDPDPGGTFG